MTQRKTLLVTGAHRELGQAMIKSLLEKNEYNLIMTCLHSEEGKCFQEKYEKKSSDAKIMIEQLDVSCPKSIDRLIIKLKEKEIKIDVLVHNESVCSGEKPQVSSEKGKVPQQQKGKSVTDKSKISPESWQNIFKTNFYGTTELTEKLIPLMNSNSRIIFISDEAGKESFKMIKNEDLKKRLRSETLKKEELWNLVKEYRESVEDNTYENKGWPKDIFGVSKLFISMYACVLGRTKQVMDRGIQVYSCSPGSIKSDVNPKGERSVQEGIKTPLHLINLPAKIDKEKQGCFFENQNKCSIFQTK